MEPQAECMLVLMGATPEGKKELIGFRARMWESAQNWKESLVDLKARGLSIAPQVATGDGALGFWKALDEAFPATRHQRCWLHKTLNVLDKFPKSVEAWPSSLSPRRRSIALRRPQFIHSFSQSLRVQLAGTGVTVIELARPGVETPLLRGEFAEEMKGPKGMDVKVLAKRAIAGIEAGKLEIRPASVTC
jgi:hypothetical protein